MPMLSTTDAVCSTGTAGAPEALSGCCSCSSPPSPAPLAVCVLGCAPTSENFLKTVFFLRLAMPRKQPLNRVRAAVSRWH